MYEEENKKLQKRLDEIEPVVQKLKIYFENHPDRKNDSSSYFHKSPQRYLMEEIAKSKYYNIYNYDNYSDEYLQYLILAADFSADAVNRILKFGFTEMLTHKRLVFSV